MILHQNVRLINGHRNKTVGDCRSSFRSVSRRISTDLLAGKETESAPPYGVIDNGGRQFIGHLCNSYVDSVPVRQDDSIRTGRNYRKLPKLSQRIGAGRVSHSPDLDKSARPTRPNPPQVRV